MRISKQMKQILTVLRKERKPIRIAEIIMKVKGLRPATSFYYDALWFPTQKELQNEKIRSKHRHRFVPEQNRVASGIAKKRVPNTTLEGRIMLALLNLQYPDAKDKYEDVKRMNVEIAEEKKAIKEANKLYASFCRTIKRMCELGLVEKSGIEGSHARYRIPRERRLRGFVYSITPLGSQIISE